MLRQLLQQLWLDLGWWLPVLAAVGCAGFLAVADPLLARLDGASAEKHGYRFFRLSVVWPWLLVLAVMAFGRHVDWLAIALPARILVELTLGLLDPAQWSAWFFGGDDGASPGRTLAQLLDRLLVAGVLAALMAAAMAPLVRNLRGAGVVDGLLGTVPQVALYLPFLLLSLIALLPMMVLAAVVNLALQSDWRPQGLLRW